MGPVLTPREALTLTSSLTDGAAANDSRPASISHSKPPPLAQVLPTLTHELSADKYGFAFGGVDPGTLHAHGKLIKVHHVSYSIGLAEEYKLHVGLRNQIQPLPGSPFKFTVVPGAAMPASTKLPTETRELDGVADEEWQHGLVFRTADTLANACIRAALR